MRFTGFLQKIRQIIVPPLYVGAERQRRAATLYFILGLLAVAFLILLALAIPAGAEAAIKGLIAAEALLLVSLALTSLGRYSFPSYLVPFGLLVINIYLSASGGGIHDTTILGFPLIIALAGLLLGKRGALVYAVLSIFGLYGIYWLDLLLEGEHPSTEGFLNFALSAELFVIAILLGLTAALIYFTVNNLTRLLQNSLESERDTRLAKEQAEQHARALEARTGQWIAGTQVSGAASSILNPDELAQQVVDLVSSRFGLYYVSLFLLDKKKEWAILHAATGKPGKEMLRAGHRLKVGSTSMIGWCIANQKARIALDVGREAVRFDNPLLPLTRSELALPLISRGEVIGALGIQSDKEAAFSQEDIATFQAMADQLATAISNARHHAQLQKELKVRRRVEKEIRTLNVELEQRVAERTQELQSANENLTALSHIKDEFVANVSHELRTPITSIMLYHSLIESRPADAKHYVVHLRRETERLARLIEDLLYISRLEQGRAGITLDKLDLNQLARDFIADRTPLAIQHQLKLVLHPYSKLPPVQADEKMIGQVLSILLTNALNYTPAGGTVTVETLKRESSADCCAGFSVSDTGPGISAEDQAHIFERFYRGKAGHESKAAGTGLGLAIAQAIVEKHNGAIEVVSTGIPGEGTRFTVWLPLGSGRQTG